MTTLITGGCGFIGRHLVARLSERGEGVRVLDEGPFDDLPEGVEKVSGSITDPDAVGRAMAGVRTLFHLAAYPHLWAPRRDLYQEVNVEGTRRVLEAAAAAGVGRIVHTSSLTALIGRGDDRRGQWIDESAQPGLDDLLGPYCRSKFLAERAALDAAGRGLPVVVVVPTLPVGPGDRNVSPPTRMIRDFVEGRAPAYLDCTLNLIDVRDVAAGHLAAAERGQIGERYILGHENLQMAEFIALLRAVTGLPIRTWPIPYALAYLFARLDETLAGLVTHRPPRAPLSGVRLAKASGRFDSSKAVRELGLPQSPIRGALSDALRWMACRGLITRPMPGLEPR